MTQARGFDAQAQRYAAAALVWTLWGLTAATLMLAAGIALFGGVGS
jgi:hypothetical protein